MVDWSVGRSVGRSVIISYKSGNLHSHAPMGALGVCIIDSSFLLVDAGVEGDAVAGPQLMDLAADVGGRRRALGVQRLVQEGQEDRGTLN